jgi:hypothetical protein
MTRKIQLFCLFTTLCTGVAIASSPVAYVYVQQPVQGDIYSSPIFAYAAASDGKLTPIKDSPFLNIPGGMVGTNGTHFITSYLTNLYSSDVASDGVIGKQASTIDTQIYSGCGPISGAELDHSGKYVWAATSGDGCNYLEKFAISPTLTYQSEFTQPSDPGAYFTLPTFSGTKEIPVGVYYNPEGFSCTPFFYEGPNGTGPAIETSPQPPPPGYGYYFPAGPITNDPTDHMAVAMVPVAAPYFDCGSYGPTQLASYLVNNSGPDYGLSTGNSGAEMPTVPAGVSSMVLNPAGTVLAVATSTGIQFFHFNGIKPITEFTGIIGTSGFITTMAWDKDNHLYAINGATGRLHVYEATTKSVKEVSGSPYDDVCGTDSCTLIVRIP